MIKTSTLTSIILLSLCFITSGCHNTNDKNKKSEGIPSLEYTVMQDRSTQQVRYGVLKPTTYYWNIMCNKIYFSDEYMVFLYLEIITSPYAITFLKTILQENFLNYP